MAVIDTVSWNGRLAELAHAHGVPGVTAAMLVDGELVELSAGVLNVETGVEATPAALFQIGSITKTFTATLAVLLAEQGALELDRPVIELVPELRLADEDVAAAVTSQHLLTHTSGIDGDHFVDTGRGDDVLERYVESCAQLGQVHPLGLIRSYCNTGFVIAGRVIERVTGGVWDDALRELLLAPAELGSTVTLPEQALRFRVAWGHVLDGQAGREPAALWNFPRSTGPAGLICTTAGNLARYGGLVARGGEDRGPLSRAVVDELLAPRIALRECGAVGGTQQGLGWILDDWDGHRVAMHDGDTIGQSAYLRVLPDDGIALALLTNGERTHGLFHAVASELLGEVAGVRVPALPTPPAPPAPTEHAAYLGTYAREGMTLEVFESEAGLRLRAVTTDALGAVKQRTTEATLAASSEGGGSFLAGADGAWTPAVFSDEPDGTLRLYCGGRATPRAS